MNYLITFVFFISSTFIQSQITLTDLQWKNRVLLVFPSINEESDMELNLTDSLEIELKDRDLVYFYFGDSLQSNTNYIFEPAYQKKLKQLYQMGSKQHSYVLIGKDGSSKLKIEKDSVDWQVLFATIDSMPMRIKEIKNKSSLTKE
ncbi:DUF4174 domain-containing protein [Cyclobacterium amurskyense]|uniref:DUF4174 domain-containing protein n=1 Tax=Cyclobacterium amurskyense TaxID=320787 RepID=A0A0H4PHZ9_9BACT|nr:DUF4174 domain-containing protein [Cyclobacterium amurskyense]AKP52660.1 hypothetical protein CA2015_3267 [Cyclobacterium amurskyense]|tara:strand:+ start:186 stop:623 length:438 start_codon:yes stop_codon:yes gene_type:complete